MVRYKNGWFIGPNYVSILDVIKRVVSKGNVTLITISKDISDCFCGQGTSRYIPTSLFGIDLRVDPTLRRGSVRYVFDHNSNA